MAECHRSHVSDLCTTQDQSTPTTHMVTNEHVWPRGDNILIYKLHVARQILYLYIVILFLCANKILNLVQHKEKGYRNFNFPKFSNSLEWLFNSILKIALDF